MNGGMNVCGILVHAHPDRIDAVEAGIAAIPGVEAHGRAAGARLIITLEDTPAMSAADALAQLNKVPGVIAVALVYHEFDPELEDPVCGTEDKPC
jgi:nitrate reductase NapD